MKKSLFQKSPLWLLLPITIISLVFAGCSSDSSDSGGSSSSITGLSYVTVASGTGANVDVSFVAPPEADAVKIVATPTSEGLNSPLDSILGSVLSSFEEAKTVTVTVPRSQFVSSSSSGAISKIILKGLRSYTSYSFNVYAVSESGESSAVSNLPEVAIPVVTTAPQDVISQSDVSILLEEDKSIKLKWDTNRIQAGLVDFTKVRFSVHTAGDTEIAVYNVDDLSAGEVTLSDINTIDPATYTVKAIYTSANGIPSAKKMVINLVPSKLKSDIQAIAGLKVEAKNKANSADADEALYISWTSYDYSAAKAGTKIAVTVSVGKFPIKTVIVNNASVTDINKAVPVAAGRTVFFPTKNAIWVSNLYGTKTYNVSVVVHDDYGSMSSAMTASAKTTDTQTEPVTGVIGRPLGNSIVATWSVPNIGDYVGVNVRLLDTADAVKPTDDDPDKNVVSTLEIRGDTILRAVFNDVKEGVYRVAVATVDATGNVSKQGDKDLFVESTVDATIASDAKKDTTAPPAPTLATNYPKYYYKANGTEVDVVLQLSFAPSNNFALQDVKSATVILSKKEGKDTAAATAATASVVSTSTYEPSTGFFMTLRNLKRDTASLVTKYTATIYYTDVFGNGDGTVAANRLDQALSFDAVSTAPQKSEVAFTNTPKGNNLYGIEIASSVSGYDNGVPLIKATVTFSSGKRLLALYGSDETVPIAAKQLDTTGSVYFGEKDGISFPEGTENTGKTAIESGGMTYKAKLFEVYNSGLYSQATALDDITVADIVSTAPEAAEIEGVTGDASTSTLIFNETTGELTVPFKESSGTAAKDPSNNNVAPNKVLYKVYATTESVSGSTADDKIKNIKDIANVRMAQVQGTNAGADRTVKFFGFSADDKDATFTVAIEAINTFNTSFSNNVTATGKAQQKTATALGSDASFSYAGNGDPKVANTYVFPYSSSSKTETIAKPTLASLTIPSGATLTKFTLTYVSGVNFKLASNASTDAVTISSLQPGALSGGQISNDAGTITVNSNVDVAGTGKYRVSLTATGSAAPYVVLTKDVSITIQKNGLSGVTHAYSTGFSGNVIKVGDTEVTGTVNMTNLPATPNDYTTQVLQKGKLLLGTSIIDVSAPSDSPERFIIAADPKAADKGPYTLILTPNAALSKSVSGSYEINFDVTAKGLTSFSYASSPFNIRKGTAISSATVSVASGATHPNGGKFSISPALPDGLSIAEATGAITGTPSAYQEATEYTVTYTPADTSTHTVSTTKISIKVAASVTYNGSPFTFVKGTSVGSSNTVTVNPSASGTYSVSSKTPLPAGLSVNSGTGAIEGTPTEPKAQADYTIEFDPTTAGQPNVSATVRITVQGISYANASYTFVKGTQITNQSVTKVGTTSAGAFSVSPSLPAGLSLAGNTGVISGTPTAAAAAANYVITFNPTPGGEANLTTTISITVQGINYSSASYSFIKGSAITNQSVTKVGTTSAGAFSVSPSLPAGLSLASDTGVISGTPTALSAAANYTITFDPTPSGESNLTVIVSIAVIQRISYANAPFTFVRGSAISNQSVTKEGTTSAGAFSVSPSLPNGLSLAGNTGVISGTPTAAAVAANYVITFNPTPSGEANLTTTISITVQGISYSSASYSFIKGSAITNQSVTKVGTTSAGVFSVSPNLPTGLSLASDTGVISGTPTALSAAANYTITFNPTPSGESNLTVIVSIAVIQRIRYANAPFTFVRGSAISNQSVTKEGTTSAGAFSVNPSLPSGLSLASNTGVISGTPTVAAAAANYVITFNPTPNGESNLTTTISITVQGISYTGSPYTFTDGSAISAKTVTKTGTSSAGQFSISPNLTTNTGLVFNTTTGQISGTPNKTSSRTTYTITFNPTPSGESNLTTTIQVTVN